MTSPRPSPHLSSTPRLSHLITLAALVASLFVAVNTIATAAVPSFPDNIVVFPNRDFVALEGYEDHVGQTVTLTVVRPGVGTIGSAQGVIEAGDPALEVNHPGGVCWGAGTGLDVTPDILPGDQLFLRDASGALLGDVLTQDAYVTDVSPVTAGPTSGSGRFTVTGHIGPDVNRAFVEQRIINPDLTDTEVARRDVRALPGGLVRDANDSYASGITFGPGDTFTATYVFDSIDIARLAASGGGERVLTWQATDAQANRQGITIAELGEVGGPGFGGCPNGALQSGPPAPTNVVANRSADGSRIDLSWTPAQPIPGTPAIAGYRIVAVAQGTTGTWVPEIGSRTSDPTASSASLTGLTPTTSYVVELRSVSAVGETYPPLVLRPLAAGQDNVAPTVSATPPGGNVSIGTLVTLSSDDGTADIYYLEGGAPVVTDIDTLADGAVRYGGPIELTASTTLTFVAIDRSNNVSRMGTATYTVPTGTVPDAPVITALTPGRGTMLVQWSEPPASTPPVTGYEVQVYTSGGTAVGGPRSTTGTQLSVTGLQGATTYQFGVRARNDNGVSVESARSSATTLALLVANAGPDQTGVARQSTIQLDGTGSTAGVTYLWQQTAGPTVALANATTLSPTFTFPTSDLSVTLRLTVSDGPDVATDTVTISPSLDTVTIDAGRYRAGKELRVSGTASQVGALITVRSGSPTGPVIGSASVTPAALPQDGGVWELRLRDGEVPATNPSPVYATSSGGGVAGPFDLQR